MRAEEKQTHSQSRNIYITEARCVCVSDCVPILSAFSRCSVPPFGDPPASLITSYQGNSGLPHLCASASVCVCACVSLGGCLSVKYDSSCSLQRGIPHTPVWGTPTHICYLPACISVLSLHHPPITNSFLFNFADTYRCK